MEHIPTYTPPPGLRTALDQFKTQLSTEYRVSLNTYADLHSFSVTRLNDFWMTFWFFSGIKASVHPTKAIDDDALIDQFPSFFSDAKLNFAENILSYRENSIAVISMNENNLSNPERYRWSDLSDLVEQYADALKSSGFRKGDIVAVIGSNCVRSLALLLATAAVGGIFSSFATDMGEKALNDRLLLLNPAFIIAESTYTYNGKRYDISRKLDTVITNVQQQNRESNAIIIDMSNNMKSRCIPFKEFLARATGASLKFEQLTFNTPLVIMFSSGTTGDPKGIVHSHGALVVNGMKEYLLHNNLGPRDTHYQYTNIGWTLWNISIGALFTRSRIILYDGSPFYPTADTFLQTLFEHEITSFGAGPRYYSELQKLDIKPRTYAPHLHSIISTGAVLTPSLASWLAEAFGPVCQISMSGGTELCGAFLHGTRSLPSFPGEMAVKALGLDVIVFSPSGELLPDGQSGELVCRKPFPNMPVKFWNDPGRKRYFSSYFSKYPHVWTHGDFVQVNPETLGVSVLGRSDGVLNPSGVRFGSSEIYNVLFTAMFRDVIVDAIVVGQQRLSSVYSDPAERVILFIKCSPQASSRHLLPSPKIEYEIRKQIEKDLSRRHVPAFIFETKDVPYNANGKKLEIQVKAILCGGRNAFKKLQLTHKELRQLEWFEQFYHIEDVLARLRYEGLPRL